MAKRREEPKIAFEDLDFLHGDDGRNVRLLSEFVAPKAKLDKYNIENTIVFFGSARTKSPRDLNKAIKKELATGKKTKELKKLQRLQRLAYSYDDAQALAKKIGEWSHKQDMKYTICTGGGPGIMEAGNRGAKEAKAPSIGLNINLPFEQHSNPYITDELNMQFHYFFTRKVWFLIRAKAIVVFPGGFGTMDEFFEVITLIQTNKMQGKIPVVLYSEDFWRELFNFDLLVDLGMINKKDLELFTFCNSVDEAFDYVTNGILKINKQEKNKKKKGFGSLW